jgi:hypothetical protein
MLQQEPPHRLCVKDTFGSEADTLAPIIARMRPMVAESEQHTPPNRAAGIKKRGNVRTASGFE